MNENLVMDKKIVRRYYRKFDVDTKKQYWKNIIPDGSSVRYLGKITSI